MNDLEPLDLRQLRTFYEVARGGSVSHAARVLGRSQPAVSHRLKALQDDLGAPLFERTGRRLRLTPLGQRLMERCQDLLSLTQDIRALARDAAGEVTGRVSVGTYGTAAMHLLVDPLAELTTAHPKLSFGITMGLTAQLCDQLRSGVLDILLVALDGPAPGLVAEPVAVDRMVAVMTPELAPRRSGSITVEELRTRRYISWSGRRESTFDDVGRYAERQGLYDERTIQIPHITTQKRWAQRGVGYAIVPSYTVAGEIEDGSLVALSPEGLELPLEFSVVVRERQYITPAVEVVREVLMSLEIGLGG